MCDNKDMRPNVSIFGVFYFFITEKVRNAVQSRKKLREVYRESVSTVRQCQNWFSKFRFDDFNVLEDWSKPMKTK